ncbi:lipoyl(octanoyl) transferase LipB [Thermophagus xiamenensis]|jgi:lipoyl(octanoyl) transferase|uniref:Octanoyltransferase n=1 Tax=Thermophagus xiamenensis TaxID=385682 RepID=A0A1I1UP50_9BACT|nr:lipoyl(octanoyl) transferase LipB [Thermophagus xiamenensis]SFD72547.1 lipoyl(octanoyl) transferase [Thermophagus xiamenensis]
MTTANTIFEDIGVTDYKKAWDYQEEKFQEIVDAKLFNREHPGHEQPVTHRLIFCEHPHVYTLGKNGQPGNLLVQENFLKQINASFYKINRGGDITYHGPGQIVGYPIFDLEQLKLGVKEYIHLLEEAIIQTLSAFGTESERMDGATGVWLDTNGPNARKICAIGVRASRFVSMHGFALNVNTDLKYFGYINPCGFVDKGVTSLEKEKGSKMDMNEVKKVLKDNLKKVFGLNFV